MFNLIDLILLAVIACFVFVGAKNGFVRTLLSFVAKIASLVVAYFVSDMYAETVYNSFLKESVLGAIEKQIASTDADNFSQQFETAVQSIPDSLLKIAETFGMDMHALKEQSGDLNLTGELVSALEQSVAGPIVVIVCRILIFVIVSAVASFLLGIVVNIISNIVKLPVLRTANKLLGAVLGLLNGAVCVFILSFICVVVSVFIDNTEFTEAVNSSYMVNYLNYRGMFI